MKETLLSSIISKIQETAAKKEKKKNQQHLLSVH